LSGVCGFVDVLSEAFLKVGCFQKGKMTTADQALAERLAARIPAMRRAQTTAIFDFAEMEAYKERMKREIKAEVVSVTISTLGGEHRASFMITIGLDPKDTWANGIFENSRYMRLMLERDGTLEQFTASKLSKKLRKSKVKSVPKAIEKLNKYIQEVQ